jgi:hypothetical protein
MKFSEQAKKQAAEFVKEKGQKIVNSRKIPAPDIGKAWITVNEIESGWMEDVLVGKKFKELKDACAKDEDLRRFWENNAQEFDVLLVTETA